MWVRVPPWQPNETNDTPRRCVMGNKAKKAKRKLEARQKAFDDAKGSTTSGVKRPGSIKHR